MSHRPKMSHFAMILHKKRQNVLVFCNYFLILPKNPMKTAKIGYILNEKTVCYIPTDTDC